MRYALQLAIDKGSSLDKLNSISSLNLKAGIHNEQGFRPIVSKKISMQFVEATRAAINLKKICQEYKLNFAIEFQWGEKSPYAGKMGFLGN